MICLFCFRKFFFIIKGLELDKKSEIRNLKSKIEIWHFFGEEKKTKTNFQPQF